MHSYSGLSGRRRPARDGDEDGDIIPHVVKGRPGGRGYTQSARNPSIAEESQHNVRRTLSTPNGARMTAANVETKEDYRNIHQGRLVPQSDRRFSASSSNSSQRSSAASVTSNAVRCEPGRKASVQSNPGYEDDGSRYSQNYQEDRRATETYDRNSQPYNNQQSHPLANPVYGGLPSPNSRRDFNARNSVEPNDNMNTQTRAGPTQNHGERTLMQQRNTIQQYQQHEPWTYPEKENHSRREGSISPMNQNDTNVTMRTQHNGGYSSEPASYYGQTRQIDRESAMSNNRMENLDLDRSAQDRRNWSTQKPNDFNEVLAQNSPTASSGFRDQSPTFERLEHISNEPRDRDSGYAGQDQSTVSSRRGSLSTETNPYQNRASIWQDGRSKPRELSYRILKLDTQCEKSNWVSSRIVNDLKAVTTALKNPQSFSTASGELMTAEFETILTFRFDGQDVAFPQTRFFVAPATDFPFDIILGAVDIRKYGLLSLPNYEPPTPAFLAIAHALRTDNDRAIEAQRSAVFEKLRIEEAKRTKHEKQLKKGLKSNRTNQGESSRGHRRDDDREDNSHSRWR